VNVNVNVVVNDLLPGALRPLSLVLCLLAACAPEPRSTGRDPTCTSRLATVRAARDAALRAGVRAATRADLEAVRAGYARLLEQCPGQLVTRVEAADLAESVARASRQPEDVDAALRAWGDVARLHGREPGAARAQWRRARLALDLDQPALGRQVLEALIAKHPRAPEAARAEAALAALEPHGLGRAPAPAEAARPAAPTPDLEGTAVSPERLGIAFPAAGKPAQLSQVLRFGTAVFSRVVVHFSHPVRYQAGVLPAEGAAPPRLYVDFPGAELAPTVPRSDAHAEHVVRGLRLANRPPAAVRLVLDLAGAARYQVYPLEHPYRVVLDLWARAPGGPAAPADRPRVRVVALDPGHGGAENGAVGPRGLKEKDVTLAVARHAAEALRAGGLKAVLTREGDTAVSLEERSAIALAVGADLFVSIHANAEPTHRHTGVETYYLDVESDDYAARLAARENRAAGVPVGPYRLVLADLTTRATTALAADLARTVHGTLLAAARVHQKGLPDRGVRKAIFYVLLTARVPGILTEISFLSHPEGEAALGRPEAQTELGRGIARGVLAFARKTGGVAPALAPASAPAPASLRPDASVPEGWIRRSR
jgi:N-acetylmuramoyl-L-alanine amidase